MAGFLNLFRTSPGTITALDRAQVLFSKGDSGEQLYVIEEGEIEILDGDKLLETLGEGDIFGEMAVVDGEARSATARAKVPSTVMAINERQFLKMISDSPFFAIQVMRVMSARLRAANARVAAGRP